MTAEEILEVAGIRVLVRVAGEGQPVLLIHGLGSHTMMWARVERAWSGLRLVSFDAPGVGRSPTRFPPLVATGPGWGCVLGRWASIVHLYNPLLQPAVLLLAHLLHVDHRRVGRRAGPPRRRRTRRLVGVARRSRGERGGRGRGPGGQRPRDVPVDLESVFLCSRAALEVMPARGSGKIVNVASVFGAGRRRAAGTHSRLCGGEGCGGEPVPRARPGVRGERDPGERAVSRVRADRPVGRGVRGSGVRRPRARPGADGAGGRARHGVEG